MSLIEVKNVSYKYSSRNDALNNVSFNVERGEFVCILGHNGSGKSTLAKIIVGLLKAKSGEVIIDGVVLKEDTIDSVRQKLGIVFQNPDNQFVGITVKDDIAFGLENRNVKREEILEKVNYYSKLVDMEEFLDKNPENLSGGQKQRVAIAGVLALEGDIIVFDEATSMLDPKGVSEVTSAIKTLKGKKTVLYITHNLSEALFCDRVIILNKGELVFNGSVIDAFKEKEILKSSSLDTLDSMKLIDMIEENGLNKGKEIEEILWQLTYQK